MYNYNYAQLYDTYGKPITQCAYQILHNRSDAEDVLHEVFTKMMEYTIRSQSDAPITDVKHWLMITTKRTAFEYKKKFYKFQTVELDEEQPAAENENIETRVFFNQVLDDLNRHNHRWFSIIAMRGLLDLTYKDISLIYCIPLPVVKIEIYRARKYMYKKNHISYDEVLGAYVLALTLGSQMFYIMLRH